MTWSNRIHGRISIVLVVGIVFASLLLRQCQKFRSLHGSNNENTTKKERKEEETRLVLSLDRYILIHVLVIYDKYRKG